jgi:4-amino-4-deoxy-L-arabinose transferase-like glycosyltransferase
VFGLAVLVRVVYFLQYHASPLNGYHVLDHQYYLEWARQVAAGEHGVAVFEQGPLYPYLLGAAFRVVGERIALIVALQMAVGTMAVVLTYLSARRLWDTRTALLGGVLAAVYGPLVFYECMVMKSFLSPVLTVAAFYAGLRWADGGRAIWLALQGAAIGLACLERESHILLWIPAVAWIWSLGAEQPRAGSWRLARMGILTATVMACIAPTALRNWLVSGQLVIVTAGGGEVFFMAHGPHANGYYRAPDFVKPNPFVEHEDFRREAQRRAGHLMTRGQASRFWFRAAWEHAAAHPARTLWLTAKKAVILLNDFEVNDSENYRVARRVVGILYWLPSFGWISGLGLLGAAVCLCQGKRFQLLLGFVAAHVATVLLTYNFGRFRLGLTPLWCLLAACGIAWLVERWRHGDRAMRWRAAAYGAIAALATVVAFLPPPGVEEMTYAIDDHIMLGRLGSRAGQFDFAETQYQHALLRMRQHEAQFPVNGGNQEALLAARCGDTLLEHGQAQRAIRYYRHALALPNPASEREILLRHWVSVLRTFWRNGDRFQELPDPQSELKAAIAELQQNNPQEAAYWAIAAQWARDDADAGRIRDGLERACAATAAEVPAAAWCAMGRAFLAHAAHAPEKARRHAREALELWPEHPWRAEISELLSE